MSDTQLTGIQFDPVEHKYTYSGEEFISTTTLLKQYGLSADYANVPPDVLKKAATRGNAVHKAIELFVGGDTSMLGLMSEVDAFNNYITMHNIDLTDAKSEEILFDTNYKVAGTADLQYRHKGINYISDIKTTYVLHEEPLAWQLSIYNYLISKGDVLSYYFNEHQVFHFTKGKLVVKKVRRIEFEAVEALLQAHLNQDPIFIYQPDLSQIISDGDVKFLEYAMAEMELYNDYAKQLKSKVDDILDKVKPRLINSRRTSLEVGDIRLTYQGGYTRTSIDKDKFEQYITGQNQNIDDFIKTTQIKDRLNIKLLKDVQAESLFDDDEGGPNDTN